tara:strand:+ start:480 stop:689 length:210 start_codon:yes stop_codon:yes gene_type:complete
MQNVWMVWQTVDFGQDWMMGVFASADAANAAMDDMFTDWMSDRDMTAAQFAASQMDDPFFVTTEDVQGG